MLLKKVKLSAVLLLGINLSGLRAQDAILTSGSDAQGNGSSVSFSVGLVVYSISNGVNGSVGQGVQQPYEISVVIGIEDFTGITLKCSAYPNPANDYLILKVEETDITNLSYKLFEVSGKLIVNKNIESSETRIAMSSLIPASYFLKVMQDSKEIKTFKIIKN